MTLGASRFGCITHLHGSKDRHLDPSQAALSGTGIGMEEPCFAFVYLFRHETTVVAKKFTALTSVTQW